MIKRLRIKFILVLMAIVVVLLGSVLSVVIHFAKRNMQMQSVNLMRTVATGAFLQEPVGKPPAELRLQYFVVMVSPRGDIVSAGSGQSDFSYIEDLEKLVRSAMSSRNDTGILSKYNLRYLKMSTPTGYRIVFSDITIEREAEQEMILWCAAIFGVVVLLFFGISIFLSRWVIKPVAVAWDQQRQFVADASHELKTPLSVIMANAELMGNEDIGEEERKKFTRNILSMSYQMRALVESMLSMARVDAAAVDETFENVHFSQLVEDAVLSFQLLYEERKLGFASEIAEGICLYGSERQLFQVLDVLLDNALKYSVLPGQVHVALTRSGRYCTLSVSSPGPHISKEDLHNIFKRFYRVDKVRSMNGSYGLGLSIAEAIVVNHKGKIWATSEGGSNTFTVQLPMHNTHGNNEKNRNP